MTTNEFQPNWASAPGDTIADILRERNISIGEFAQKIDYKLEDVKDLIQGRTTITLSIARRLEEVLGASVEFWMVRDLNYWQNVAGFNITDEQWVSEFPIDDMVKFEWVKTTTNLRDKIDTLLHFFDVPNVQSWNKNYARVKQLVAFKKSKAFESRPASVAVWIRQGEIQAEKIVCKPWNAKGFESSLALIRSLTKEKDPARFLPELQKICAENGVAVTIVRTPKGCPASGATKFIDRDKALLLLSFRYLTDDHFWFSFFHEAGHLLLHSEKRLFIEGADILLTVEEEEANEFAANTLIPVEFKTNLLKLRGAREVIRFSMTMGISPGIVVGQLQHLGIIPRDYLNKLKRRFTWSD
jgi:HTH-type transcriptional regulator / antitoxin HigA